MECFKGPNCKQTQRFEFHIMTWPSIAAFDTGRVPALLYITNQLKVQQSGVTKGKYSKTASHKKPSVFIFKAIWARSFTVKKKGEKKICKRAYCLTAGSVSVWGDYLYSTPTTLRLHKSGDKAAGGIFLWAFYVAIESGRIGWRQRLAIKSTRFTVGH